MPEIGETKLGKTRSGHHRSIWSACVDCGKERWTRGNLRCTSCAARRRPHSSYKGKSIGNIEKPILGDVRPSEELNKRGGNDWFIWHECKGCGKKRWVSYSLKLHKPRHLKCPSCSRKGKKKPRLWKDVKRITRDGYIEIKLHPDDFFYPMADKEGYVREHRLVMAKYLGRCLQKWEIVHHKGKRYTDIKNKSDNLIDNLELTATAGEHSKAHTKGYRDGYQKGLIDGRNSQIEELRQQNDELLKQIKLLQWQQRGVV